MTVYAWLYRTLPGPTPVRILLVLLLLVAVFFLLMEVVFPAVEPYLPHSDVSVNTVAQGSFSQGSFSQGSFALGRCP